MKTLLKTVVALLLVLVVAVLAAPLYVDRVVHAAVERGGTRALGVETELGSADIDLLGGTLGLSGLRVRNPEGFPSDDFLGLDEGSASVVLGTLLDDVVELPSLRLVGARINLERRGGRGNWEVILANFGSADAPDEPRPETPPDESAKGYVVGELVLRDAVVHTDLLPVGGAATRVTVPLREIRLEGLGSDNARGVLLSELAEIVVQAVLEAVAEEGVGVLPDDVLEDLERELGQLVPLAERGIESTTEALEDAAGRLRQDVDRAVDDATKRLDDRASEALKGLGEALGGG